MSLTATLGPIRSTTPRGAGVINPISTFSALLADVKGAGLLARTRIFYISVFTTLVLALGGAITGFLLLGDSWFQLIIAGVLGIIFTQFAFLGHEASHRQVFESGTGQRPSRPRPLVRHRRHQLLVVDEQALAATTPTRTRSARTPTSRSTPSPSSKRMLPTPAVSAPSSPATRARSSSRSSPSRASISTSSRSATSSAAARSTAVRSRSR